VRDATSYSVAQINSPCHHLLATRPRGLNHAVAVESSLPLVDSPRILISQSQCSRFFSGVVFWTQFMWIARRPGLSLKAA